MMEEGRTVKPPLAVLRPPSEVMRLSRLGSFFPTRLSFMRSLVRDMCAAKVAVSRELWDINSDGYGCAVYSFRFGARVYSLVAMSKPLDAEKRTDRVIAEAWDTAYCLYDGRPNSDEIDRLSYELPRQEAGRFTETELVLSRANRSVRFFGHVVDCLAAGRQPDRSLLRQTGYLMRTTAVYGNGKFGIADRSLYAARPELSGPFRAELLTVWLIREFTLDLVEHIARCRAPDRAVTLCPEFRRYLGVGNSTGLGMAPFLVSHPTLLHNWISARENALARVRAVKTPSARDVERIVALVRRAECHVAEWNVADERQMRRIERLMVELSKLGDAAAALGSNVDYPWDRLIEGTEDQSLECQELAVSLVLEPYGSLIDDLVDTLSAAPETRPDASMSVGELGRLLAVRYRWAMSVDFSDRGQTEKFWYVSAEKAEPRIGRRHEEDGAARELPLDIARQARALADALPDFDPAASLAELLLQRPDLRHIVRRVQIAALHPYSEIVDNLIAADCLPIDMLRCKLSFFGASKFDPKSDLWTRITLYQGAPGRSDIGKIEADDWAFPHLNEPPLSESP